MLRLLRKCRLLTDIDAHLAGVDMPVLVSDARVDALVVRVLRLEGLGEGHFLMRFLANTTDFDIWAGEYCVGADGTWPIACFYF